MLLQGVLCDIFRSSVWGLEQVTPSSNDIYSYMNSGIDLTHFVFIYLVANEVLRFDLFLHFFKIFIAVDVQLVEIPGLTLV